MPSPRSVQFDALWFNGLKSDSDPALLPPGYYFFGLNVINEGGLISTRHGYRCIVDLPAGKLQGLAVFRPAQGLEQLLVGIDGKIYVSTYPFADWRLIENLLFSPHAKQLFFALTEQSARRLTPNDLGSAIEIIPTRKVLFIQDGGSTAPGFYDGSQSGHVRDFLFETPSGGPMVWLGDRLWVASGSHIFASDIANPFSFREQIYLGGTASFTTPGDVTALASTPGADSPQLLAFTDRNTELIRANIRDRNAWPTTNDMQREILKVGATGQRSVVSHYGQLAWMSNTGVMFFDSAIQSNVLSRLPIRDNEMAYSKVNLADDLSLVAAAGYGKYLVFSVPYEDCHNRHTWVLNASSFETLKNDSGPSWASVWTGTRPVEWVTGPFAGADRAYYISVDYDGENRLWEAFLPERLDNHCPITSAAWMRGYFGISQDTQKAPGSDSIFRYADIALTGVEETLDIGAWYAGSLRGGFKQVMRKRIEVQRGNIWRDRLMTATTKLFAYKAQSRSVRTEDAVQLPQDTETGSCPPERDVTEERDDAMQLLVVWHGPATIRYVRAWAQPQAENLSGGSDACATESPYNLVKFDGAGATSTDLEEADAIVQTREMIVYTSNQSATLERNGFSAVGVGSAESVVTQAAADRVAHCTAEGSADAQLLRVLPRKLSSGKCN